MADTLIRVIAGAVLVLSAPAVLKGMRELVKLMTDPALYE